jgi:hypothetical protein
VILHCNYEELRALTSASEAIVADADTQTGGHAGMPEGVARVEELLPRLDADLSIDTLIDQRRVAAAVRFICGDLHRRMDERIIETSPADEDAVTMYFDYGHSRTVLYRLDQMGAEMEAIADLIGGSALTFPD